MKKYASLPLRNSIYGLKQAKQAEERALHLPPIRKANFSLPLTALCERFKMKNLSKFHWCLGIRIVQNVKNGTLSIDQGQMSDCKGVKTPLCLTRFYQKQ
ncbi:hypothetical protein T4C_2016 [Trichinella pseudospiralis]|uniref:Uncharacterized protein n=1 Tax=Trichinella pseudospiralis TaxID=6337 RepID=A0A0V1K6I8_TRIPS|nr:hypothetical protein T4C_2016 [Trichinella pseudospiralis]